MHAASQVDAMNPFVQESGSRPLMSAWSGTLKVRISETRPNIVHIPIKMPYKMCRNSDMLSSHIVQSHVQPLLRYFATMLRLLLLLVRVFGWSLQAVR
jgi:hypothetical protein